MPAVNSAGKTRIDQSEQPVRACAGGDAEQADLGRGVEAEAEQQAQRVHVPAALDQAEQRPEQAAEQAALAEQQVEVLLDVGAAALDRVEGAVDRDEDEQVGGGDGEQEQRRDRGADRCRRRSLNASKWLCSAAAVAAMTMERAHDHGGMAEREEEAGARAGGWPSCISLRVTLSMAAMWSASKAWRSPKL